MIAKGTTYKSSFETAPRLRDENITNLLPPSRFCTMCHAAEAHSLPLSSSSPAGTLGAPGTISWMPQSEAVPADSCVRQQPHVTDGALGHPCLTLAESECGHQAFVAPMTSWGGMGIAHKVKSLGASCRPENFLWEHMALGLPGTPSECGHPLLETTKASKRPSFVHLADGFWIEKVQLSPIKGQMLTEPSVEVARRAYAVAEWHRAGRSIPCSRVQQRPAVQVCAPMQQQFAPVQLGFMNPYTYAPQRPQQWQQQQWPALPPVFVCV